MSLLLYFIIFIIIYTIYEYLVYYYNTQNYKKAIGEQKYFFMMPQLYYYYYTVKDLSNYNKKSFNQSIENANSFCKNLFFLNLGLQTDNDLDLSHRKSLLEKLEYHRLQTINHLESINITIYSDYEKINNSRLLKIIEKINSDLIMNENKIWDKYGMDYSEKRLKCLGPDEIENKFYFYYN